VTPSEALRALFAAWERLDADEIAELFTEDGVYDDPLKDGRVVGREEIRRANEPAVAALADCSIRVVRLLEDGDVGVAEGFFAAGLAGGEGRLDFPFAAVVELRDGRIARLAEYFDTRPLVP
jgi:limonene-1,2-epoxide hydrolase